MIFLPDNPQPTILCWASYYPSCPLVPYTPASRGINAFHSDFSVHHLPRVAIGLPDKVRTKPNTFIRKVRFSARPVDPRLVSSSGPAPRGRTWNEASAPYLHGEQAHAAD